MHTSNLDVQALNNPAPRFLQSQNVAREVSMTSLELVEFINAHRSRQGEYGISLVSDRWARDWEPFVQLCFDACYDIDAKALSPIGRVIYQMKEAA